MVTRLFLWLLRRRQTACSRCPHDRGSHPSYIPGGDRPGPCAARTTARDCPCWQYKPERPWALALAFLRERPAPVTADVLRPRPVPFPVPDPAEAEERTRLDIRIARPYAGTDGDAR